MSNFRLLVFLFFSFSLITRGQGLIYNKSVTGVCYAGDKVTKIYIPPPKEFLTKAESKGGGKINVIYSGFTENAKTAMEYAVSILESVLPPDLNITIKATWNKITSSGVLGNSSITAFAAGWSIDAFKPDAYYPVSVAEKIAGKSLNEDHEADIELIINSTINWYYGTDGKTPITRYDLVTVIIHELCHGLGFFDSMDVENNSGSYGLGTIPVIYDLFVENLDGKRLVDTLIYNQNSRELYNELVGGNLFFNGPLTKSALSGARARLYSPSSWDPGSSVSHLDELRTSKENALMTPFIDRGEAIHDPGKLTLSILGDMGWINTRILPRKIKDTEDRISEIEVAINVKSDTLFNRNNVGLVYSFNGFITSDTLNMIASGPDDFFVRKIGIPGYNTKMDYYFYAVDQFSRIFRSPSSWQKKPYTVFIGVDTVKPVITHTKTDYYFENIDSMEFSAKVTDNLGIDTVYLEYRVNDGTTRYAGLTELEDDNYFLNLGITPGLLTGGDKLHYRLVAIDNASRRNTRTLPSSGFFSVTIEPLGTATKTYSTDFSNASADFFTSGFEITKPLNFSSLGLHSEHPYKSPDKDYASLDFSAVLRHPIIFDKSGMMISYRELVLVEPGAEGSVFGFSDFYDYVVVEGSKDYGKNWFSLVNGYDSRINSSWETAYNSSIDGQNSTFEGDESMMMARTIYPKVSDKIAGGESLLIRFRLHADPYARGWGWAIDDLKINPLVDAVSNETISDFKVYPNPGHGLFTIVPGDNTLSDLPYTIQIYNIAGQLLVRKEIFDEGKTQIDISDNTPGLYFIVINSKSFTKTFRYSLIK